MNSKGLSTSIAAIFLIVIIVAILIPLGVSLFNNSSLQSTTDYIDQNYAYYRNLDNQYLSQGIVDIEYCVYPQSGQNQRQLSFTENASIVSAPLNSLEITGIYCLDNGQWNEVQLQNGMSYPVEVSLSYVPYTLNLPPTTQSPGDLLIVLNNGLMVFLAPNSTNY
ncbi:hypothetical protein [Sulfuracidifex metallicus]|uniref:Type IV pilin n=1 Tax=Sulfuracidifex metallicus DSM 6482 = JCM 9184 TaxID=523847 RepID=A0A6A9QP62_SULME|nr:hypothetical protein [Sulfuracidifex metallicus]MUN29528.1 hypothetical protein [Sulfuracidifex metallicus DSM 6482 = JCM 9184]WOE49961.1 hypothetical protein RQ359_001454 [Sulfuracidifex metallicus DSM 6482 = JCM 9184]